MARQQGAHASTQQMGDVFHNPDETRKDRHEDGSNNIAIVDPYVLWPLHTQLPVQLIALHAHVC